jgi:hypothetical protein
MNMFKYYKRNIDIDYEALMEYVTEEREINGQKIKVKVYPSQADKYISHWRTVQEAAPVQKGRGGDK